MANLDVPFFTETEPGLFHGNDPARGPWAENACHAGPAIGIVVRAAERLLPEKRMTRVAADLMRPVPLDGFTIEAEVTRHGRLTASAEVRVVDMAGRECARANTLHIAETDVGPVPTAPSDIPDFAASTPGEFPVREVMHGAPCFMQFVEVRYPPGETREPGPTSIWMRTPPLLAGEAPSTFQRLCTLADSGNGISRNVEITEMGFMNCDIAIVVHRHSDADWFCSRARSHWQPNGIALAEAEIFDDKGPVASVLQTVVLMPR